MKLLRRGSSRQRDQDSESSKYFHYLSKPVRTGVQVNGSLFPTNGVTNNPGSQSSNVRNTHLETNLTSADNRLVSFILLNKNRRFHFAILFFLLILLVASVSFGIAISLPIKDLVTPTTSPNTPKQLNLPNQLHIYSKADWRGLDSKKVNYMSQPALFVVISHTATTQCYNFSTCSDKVQSIQNYHFSKGFDDIGHNFIISLQGDIYEGRGWNVVNYHTGVVEGCNIAIGLIGNFLKDYPSKQMLRAIQNLIELGISKNEILSDYILIGHKQIKNTESPGTNVLNELQKWPHYVTDLTSLRIENCQVMNASINVFSSEEMTTLEAKLSSIEG